MSEKQKSTISSKENIRNRLVTSGVIAVAALSALIEAPRASADKIFRPTPHERRLNHQAQAAVVHIVHQVEQLKSKPAVGSTSPQSTGKFGMSTYTSIVNPRPDGSNDGQYVFNIFGKLDKNYHPIAADTDELIIEVVGSTTLGSPTETELVFSRNPRNLTWEVGATYNNTTDGAETFLHKSIAPTDHRVPRVSAAELRAFIKQAEHDVVERAIQEPPLPINPMQPAFYQAQN